MKAGAGLVDPAAEFDHAVAMMNQGRWSEALAGFEAVVQLLPGHVPSLNNRGVVLARLNRHADALASFDAALAINPQDAIALNNRGEELQNLMRPDEALASFDAALALAPDFPQAHGNRGHLLGQIGRRDDAVKALEQAIALAPATTRFYHHLAPLRRFAAGDPMLARMQRLAANDAALSPDERMELAFALGKALADAGDFKSAFDQFALANGLKRQTFSYDEPAALGELERIGSDFDAPCLSRMRGMGDPDATPVLIVGMPRSGSTLVEQILASAPGVCPAGERSDLEEVVSEHLRRAGLGAFPDDAARLPPGAMKDLGEDYVRRLRALSTDATRIVDKTLSNFRYLGLVHAALPNARIVHVRRDPLDTCMSCFSLLFGGHQPFAYDLAELGRYYLAYEGLMRTWRALLPADVMLDVRYEDLVADPEGQARRLLDHCGLAWDPRCLEFHRTERLVRTSSASQVRRPLYTSAVGASRVYAPYIAPLIEALGGQSGRRTGSDVLGNSPAGERGQDVMAVKDLERKAASGDVRAQRDLAQALDDLGRHSEAIDWLARAGQAGDADALTELGLRLIIGRNAPCLPADGVRLLGDAAQAGGAEAAGHLAVLIGGGIHARQSWPVALDCLQRAAEMGSRNSQEQLEILAGAKAGAGAGGWASLRQSVDIEAWTRAPDAERLSDSPRIGVVRGLIPKEACAWAIEQSRARLVRAELYDPQTGKPVLSTETRLNQIASFTLADTCLLNLLIQAKMSAAVGLPFQSVEAFSVLHYSVGEEYGEHVDFLDPAIAGYAEEIARKGQRIATCLVYLNEGYEGGETEFPELGLSFKGGLGDALTFVSADPATGRPDPRTVHAGRAPTAGEKWLLSQFFRNRPVIGAGAG